MSETITSPFFCPAQVTLFNSLFYEFESFRFHIYVKLYGICLSESVNAMPSRVCIGPSMQAQHTQELMLGAPVICFYCNNSSVSVFSVSDSAKESRLKTKPQ